VTDGKSSTFIERGITEQEEESIIISLSNTKRNNRGQSDERDIGANRKNTVVESNRLIVMSSSSLIGDSKQKRIPMKNEPTLIRTACISEKFLNKDTEEKKSHNEKKLIECTPESIAIPLV